MKFLTAVKRYIKTLKRLGFQDAKPIIQSNVENLKFFFILRSHGNHVLTQEVLKFLNEDECFFVIDDQVGYSSAKYKYKNYIKVKKRFSLSSFGGYLKNSSTIVADVVLSLKKVLPLDKMILVSYYDREEVLQEIFDTKEIQFFKTASMQHGVMIGVDQYYPFNSDYFYAFSEKDREFAKGKIDLDRIEVVGNLFINQQIDRQVASSRIKESVDRKNKKVLIATTPFFLENLSLLKFAADKAQKDSSVVFYFKPHPNDRLTAVYKTLISIFSVLSSGRFFYEEVYDFTKYDFLMTRFSSLIIEALHQGVLPILSGIEGAEHFLGKDLFFIHGFRHFEFDEVREYYRGRTSDLLDFFLLYNAPEKNASQAISEHLYKLAAMSYKSLSS